MYRSLWLSFNIEFELTLLHLILFIAEILMFENFDLEHIITPVNVEEFQKLLKETNYNKIKSDKLIKGFSKGFPLGYQGQRLGIQRKAPNLKLRVGGEIDLWNKVMKEVKVKRYAGPFAEIPYDDFIQSPIGLVPKDDGNDTRLIFHLSYPRNGKSVNSETPKEICSVHYPEFDLAIKRCIEEGVGAEISKSDLKSAFRFVPMSKRDWKFLIMKARNPIDKKWYYFIDKCMPFGSSISCAHFQEISDALAHIQKIKSGGKIPINYLGDFL